MSTTVPTGSLVRQSHNDANSVGNKRLIAKLNEAPRLDADLAVSVGGGEAGDEDFAGYQLSTKEMLDATVSPANCKTVLSSTTTYHYKTGESSTGPRFQHGIQDDELRSGVCQASCGATLSNDVRRVNGVCAGWSFEDGVPAAMAGKLRPARPSRDARQRRGVRRVLYHRTLHADGDAGAAASQRVMSPMPRRPVAHDADEPLFHLCKLDALPARAQADQRPVWSGHLPDRAAAVADVSDPGLCVSGKITTSGRRATPSPRITEGNKCDCGRSKHMARDGETCQQLVPVPGARRDPDDAVPADQPIPRFLPTASVPRATRTLHRPVPVPRTGLLPRPNRGETVLQIESSRSEDGMPIASCAPAHLPGQPAGPFRSAGRRLVLLRQPAWPSTAGGPPRGSGTGSADNMAVCSVRSIVTSRYAAHGCYSRGGSASASASSSQVLGHNCSSRPNDQLGPAPLLSPLPLLYKRAIPKELRHSKARSKQVLGQSGDDDLLRNAAQKLWLCLP
ncbi:hypothetical protein MAPG_05776 [Magnaporthiopsis poae ATCC 64411]|uniref:Uncharacterized protein n=1 Tax=Magnaporthiopsis poae (strain ATCC 64411 / 73-15) TaxID=644358 RepID=A0A0C4E0A7_MAGP6|nr:hypothetical protein MAPG_05776 [Magnaporthiopsis poae ATCC 64411]